MNRLGCVIAIGLLLLILLFAFLLMRSAWWLDSGPPPSSQWDRPLPDLCAAGPVPACDPVGGVTA